MERLRRSRNGLGLLVAAVLGTSAAGAQSASSSTDRVAFLVAQGATVIDFAGPWEVFQDVMLSTDGPGAYELYTVAETRQPVRLSGGLQVVPDHTFDDAPPPAIVVVGAQGGPPSPRTVAWLQKMRGQVKVLMSVCTGAFALANAGLLDGKPATTHHDFYETFRRRFPKVTLVTGKRYVKSDPVVFTAGGLTSGVDLALHVLETLHGKQVAVRTAAYMEYESKSWME
jgi:transcriptional regulator GlxA family with amidase domain